MLSWTSLALSVMALLAALFAVVESFQKRPAPLVQKYRAEVADLADAYERLQKNLRKLQMRINTEAGKQRAAAEAEHEPQSDGMMPGESPEQWKKRMRLALHQAKMGG